MKFTEFLEDSADNGQNLSSQFLEHVEKENSLCGSAANSRAESVHSKACLSVDLSEEDDEPEVVNVKIRRKARRIDSDDEDEHTFKDTSSTNPFNTSPFPFLSVKQFDASTPKNDISLPERFFSPKISDSISKSVNSRRSLASRRSLINVVLDHVEDMFLHFNMLSKLVIAFFPRSKHLLISWLQSPSAVILEPKKIKSVTVSVVSLSICHEVMRLDAMI